MKAIKFTKRIAELAVELTEDSRVYVQVTEPDNNGDTEYTRLLSLVRVKSSDLTVDRDGDLVLVLEKPKNG